MKIEKIIPELIVKDIQSMINFYSKYFGFKIEATDPEETPYIWVQLTNNDCVIMMQELEATKGEISDLTDQISGTDLLMIKVESAKQTKELYKKIQEGNEKIYMPIRTTEYGSCEFGVIDPEGRYVIVSG